MSQDIIRELYHSKNVIVKTTTKDELYSVWFSDNGRTDYVFIGVLDIQKSMYIKSVDSDKHFFKNHSGFGVSCNVLRMLQLFNITKLRIIESKSGREYDFEVEQYTSEKSAKHDNFGDWQAIVSILESKQCSNSET